MTEFVPEFSRVIVVSRLSVNGQEEYVEAKPAERLALAKRFDINEVVSLKAWLTLTPASSIIEVQGKVQAVIVQNCVVTLEPLKSYLDLDMNLVFKACETGDDEAEGGLYDNINDEVEMFANGKIDIGETVAQYLGVNIDPYLRKADASLEKTEFGAKDKISSPFALLPEVVKKIDTPQK